MPRGVVIPELRQQLFAAAERLIAEHGPSRLSGRAITREAGVATGLLNAHFSTFDKFLTGYAVDRTFQLAGAVGGLPDRAGTATVTRNLTDALLATPLATVTALTRLLTVRPDLVPAVEAVLGEGVAGIRVVQRAVTAYLIAERSRLPAGADPEALALAVTAVLLHVALTSPEEDLVRRAVIALTAGRQG